MYDFGIAVAQRRWVALGHGWAGAASFTDGQVGRYYDFWMRCVANNDLTITAKWVRDNGGAKPPTADDFILAVRNGEGSSQMNRLKGW